MSKRRNKTLILIAALLMAVSAFPVTKALAQGPLDDVVDDALQEEEFPPEDEQLEEEPEAPADEGLEEQIEGGEAGEGETRWNIKINAAIRANYVFNDSPDSFLVKYRWEIKGQANSETAVIRGDADVSADVEGFLAKWPTGECSLDITIPKIPFELTFRKSGEDKGSIALKFRRNILENWQSKCTFTDAPGARFETTGEPEKWLARAIEKARPPLRSIVADVTDEETTTSFVINKEVFDDAPIGSVEIEGTGVITITPGGGE
jgi:hypothetical protein